MAFVLFSYQIQDAEGVQTTKNLYCDVDTSASIADFQTFVDLYTPLLDALTEGKITKIKAAFELDINGAKSTAADDSDVQETLLLSFEQDVTPYTYGDDIPGEVDAVIVNGRVDLTNTDLVAYVAFMTTVHGNFRPNGRFNDALIALTQGVETFRTKRKQLNARTRSRVP